MSKKYLFLSERLGFRDWIASDVPLLININQDEEVMAFFPDTTSASKTEHFVQRMQQQQAEKGFCYFAVDRLDSDAFIGFIGLSEQTYPADFTPCVDIGWRLAKAHWGQGFATEGAQKCLTYAFEDLGMEKIYSIAPVINTKSEQVMKKIGMKKLLTFQHPLLLKEERLRDCVVYEKKRK